MDQVNRTLQQLATKHLLHALIHNTVMGFTSFVLSMSSPVLCFNVSNRCSDGSHLSTAHFLSHCPNLRFLLKSSYAVQPTSSDKPFSRVQHVPTHTDECYDRNCMHGQLMPRVQYKRYSWMRKWVLQATIMQCSALKNPEPTEEKKKEQ